MVNDQELSDFQEGENFRTYWPLSWLLPGCTIHQLCNKKISCPYLSLHFVMFVTCLHALLKSYVCIMSCASFLNHSGHVSSPQGKRNRVVVRSKVVPKNLSICFHKHPVCLREWPIEFWNSDCALLIQHISDQIKHLIESDDRSSSSSPTSGVLNLKKNDINKNCRDNNEPSKLWINIDCRNIWLQRISDYDLELVNCPLVLVHLLL